MTMPAPKPLQGNSVYPGFGQYLPADEFASGNYRMRFARCREDLDAILKLRFQVFNLELGEGLESSFVTGRDEDEYDPHCHHLMITETAGDRVVGTYRLQTHDMARAGRGFYSSTEFDLSPLPAEFLDQAAELGRACIDERHRNGRVLFLLWRGIVNYLVRNQKRFFFGCCSLTSQNPAEGRRVMNHLESHGWIHPEFKVYPQPGFECYREDLKEENSAPAKLPKLMRLYLEYGARICGPPAIDRVFKTIDYLAVYDLQAMDERSRKMFLS